MYTCYAAAATSRWRALLSSAPTVEYPALHAQYAGCQSQGLCIRAVDVDTAGMLRWVEAGVMFEIAQSSLE